MLIIPAIDLIGGKCVRLLKGDYSTTTTYQQTPVEQALRFQSARFSRLHVVDLEGAKDGLGRNREAIREIVQAVRIPVQVGGGIRTDEDVDSLLSWGVKFLILGTVALKQPESVSRWVKRWGGDPFIVSLDLRKQRLQTEGWREESQVSVEEMIRRISDWGVTQVISTDIEKDGTLSHPNYATYTQLRGLLGPEVRLIAAGGVSSREHIGRLKEIGVGGAIVGKAIYENRISLEELSSAG
ncbi:MAG TPA: 1-(5-phosphoribosyl)-5-[(5-phosphoribosylamino)methylideneamino]imidazole-4-carboxamide isomerase [Acidobacteriota bacterium]|jgi:phosphoribosylformimino-5-aminoimidazole carboxamide ribotide isomerase|nr:1-(5-phosphoribosyl)-5-[(5-phosphoribosylamino)methylideneamino]imidazole-4-carboxamide isomerase [Acidobacteriota bacterium]